MKDDLLMNAEKKVFILVLLLIILIVSCVYFHTEDIANKTINTASTSEKQQIETDPIALVSKEEASITIEQEKQSTVTVQTQENNPTEETLIQEDISKNDKKIEEIVEEEPVIEQVQEKEPEPLVSLDKDKYIRTGDEKFIQDLSLESQELQIKINEILAKSPIIFKRASTEVVRKSELTIDSVARLLKKHKNIKVEIAGHTDAAGSDSLNKEVSARRAEKIRNIIASYGISDKRLVARGYGEDIPLVENDKNGYSLINRRVEFNIVED